jgi:hypothetical protein
MREASEGRYPELTQNQIHTLKPGEKSFISPPFLTKYFSINSPCDLEEGKATDSQAMETAVTKKNLPAGNITTDSATFRSEHRFTPLSPRGGEWFINYALERCRKNIL